MHHRIDYDAETEEMWKKYREEQESVGGEIDGMLAQIHSAQTGSKVDELQAEVGDRIEQLGVVHVMFNEDGLQKVEEFKQHAVDVKKQTRDSIK